MRSVKPNFSRMRRKQRDKHKRKERLYRSFSFFLDFLISFAYVLHGETYGLVNFSNYRRRTCRRCNGISDLLYSLQEA